MDQEIPFLVRRFQAMGCPCEILLDTTDASLADEQLGAAIQEAERIENKYSRFRPDSIVSQINRGAKVSTDDETAALLKYAAECFELSGGLFDIRRGSADIDLGGICKEYAADKILEKLRARHAISTLVNLGGDIAAAGDRLWSVGIEHFSQPGQIVRTIHLQKGGVATSGTTKRPDHILNPKTGLPVRNAPPSVTVAAKTCTEAGFWSTLAVLQGENAEAFLEEQGLESWCYRLSPSFPAVTGGESMKS
jgi:thiamine biosynthesis lipoprotein